MCNYRTSKLRCHTPLIEICDSVSQIKLDLLSCGVCTADATALQLKKGGCIEYKTICEEIEPDPCSCPSSLPYNKIKRTVPKPKPTVIYPLHEIDQTGMSVFVLDGKLKGLGYGRYHATVLIDGLETDLRFDVDYVKSTNAISSIDVERYQPNLGEC